MARALQRYRAANIERSHCARSSHDDERKVYLRRVILCIQVLTKNRMELLFIVLFRYLRKIKSEQLQKAAELAASKAKQALPLVTK